MDWTAIVEAAAIPLGVVGYAYRSVVGRIAAVEKAQTAQALHVAQTYVTSHTMEGAIGNFNRTVEAIFAKLEKIDDKIDKKADK